MCEYLEVDTEIIPENRQYENFEQDLEKEYEFEYGEKENGINYKKKKMARIAGICKREGADIYLNAIGGTALYEKEEIMRNGISIYFIKTEDYAYRQFRDNFVKDLSIIDFFMHNGHEKTAGLLDRYTLI